MKNWLKMALAGLSACLGCQSSTPPKVEKTTATAIVDRLIEMGYLKYAPESQHHQLRKQMIDTVQRGYLDTEWDDDCNSADRRGYHADNEDLAEGDIGKCIQAMKGVLEQEGVQLKTVEDDVSPDGYSVVVNGKRHTVYRGDEVETKNTWAMAIVRHLEIVNGLLEEAGSKERLYGVNGGNDGRTILLTPAMHEYLRSLKGVFGDDWMPYTPKELAARNL